MNVEKVKNLKVALVHDFMTVQGGAEKVLSVMHEIWPNAPVYTVTYFPDKFVPRLDDWDIRTSFVSKLPFRKLLEHQYKLFYQMAVESFDFNGYDLVISSTFAGYAKGIIVPPETVHFSYIDTVPRYLWGLKTSTHDRLGFIYKKIILPPLENLWRIWDRQTAERPDFLISNSKTVAERVRKFYRKESEVIYPPVEINDLLREKPQSEDYFVYFGRLEAYKNVDMAIKACVEANQKLKIIGDGNSRDELEKLVSDLNANQQIEFMGRAPDDVRNSIVAKAKAFIFPCSDEDFGIVPVESMAAGTPVIAFNSGGVTETVVDGKTGVLISDFSLKALTKTVERFDPSKFDPNVCRARAQKFSKKSFVENLLSFISRNI